MCDFSRCGFARGVRHSLFQGLRGRRFDVVDSCRGSKQGRRGRRLRLCVPYELREGVLYLNDKEVEEPYVSDINNTPSENNYPKTVVPDGTMFCLGDNRDVSVDSRYDTYGCMPTSWTVGVVADWSMAFKGSITAFNGFMEFTIPDMFGAKK